MDVTEENMTPKEMLDKIAELDYSQSQLRDLNTEMRHWLDVADDDMAALRSENVGLRKQVKALEKIISEAQQDEAEPCRSLLTDDIDVRRCNETKIQKMEEESTMMKEQNKNLTAELKNLQQERDQAKICLSKFKVALQTLEFGMEEAQLGLQQRDEALHQKNLQLKHSEETFKECSIIIKDLRLTNRELRKQLEDRQDEASLSALNDLLEEKEGSLSPPLSFADEIKLLASLDEAKTSTSDSKHLKHEGAEAEELLIPQSLRVDPKTKRCPGALETAVQRAGLFMMCIFILLVVAFVASRSSVGNSDLFSFSTLWTGAQLMLQPYCSVHYGASPPI
ncbi:cytospin-A-like [Xiphias gladius]|uniref:cytospin-A-like n=1 Tax=Xiphias gladius TaxID=8245 RepID=UPI001A985234|nr:cytospin-A-like [Xiphias gladius]XP_039975989.1 cytospin-A-like [Xiphias gladius]XP_039975990.1 cytospin-A-like [Xiphias gladius]XP_039975991.1 cytospin-A-like [Xiphias gladius]XP_039975993.1 cytospin-A-like [Xiphias gladius]XP_039975994.1 cytospin-A-like [Xiphias gladius]